MTPSFSYRIQQCSNSSKFLVREKTRTRNDDRRPSFLCQVSCTRNLYEKLRSSVRGLIIVIIVVGFTVFDSLYNMLKHCVVYLMQGGKGKLAVLGSCHMFSDQYIDKEENGKILVRFHSE